MPEVKETPPSPLGTDPNVPPKQDTPPSKKDETPPKPETKVKQLSQEEYDAIQQKAANFDLISEDPELAPKVLDHFKAKAGRITPRKQETPPITPEPPDLDKKMEEKFRARDTRLAQLEVQLFRKEHPDMDGLKDDMARLINQYGMSLEDSYRFSKAAKAQSSQKPQGAPPVVPSSETKDDTAGELDTSDDSDAEIEKRINDPKATPHLDDAIALAYQAAKKRHAAQ